MEMLPRIGEPPALRVALGPRQSEVTSEWRQGASGNEYRVWISRLGSTEHVVSQALSWGPNAGISIRICRLGKLEGPVPRGMRCFGSHSHF